jgi:hypothetical protein
MDLHSTGNLELDEDALASSQRPRAISSRGMSVAPTTVTPSAGVPAVGRGSGQHARVSVPPERSSISGTLAAPPPDPEVAAKPSSMAGFKKIAWYVLGGLVLFVGAVIAVRLAVRGLEDDVVIEPTAPEDPIDTPQVDPVPAGYVTIDVTGLPPGAQIRLDGLPAATMPMRVRRGDTLHRIEVSAPGYGSRRIEVVADQNRTVAAGLRPMEGMGTRVGP